MGGRKSENEWNGNESGCGLWNRRRMGNKGRGDNKKGRRVRVSDCVGEENKSREGNIGREREKQE